MDVGAATAARTARGLFAVNAIVRDVAYWPILLKKSGSRVDAIFLALPVCFSEKNVGDRIVRVSINGRSSKPIYSRG
jgi:hypothetical protein